MRRRLGVGILQAVSRWDRLETLPYQVELSGYAHPTNSRCNPAYTSPIDARGGPKLHVDAARRSYAAFAQREVARPLFDPANRSFLQVKFGEISDHLRVYHEGTCNDRDERRPRFPIVPFAAEQECQRYNTWERKPSADCPPVETAQGNVASSDPRLSPRLTQQIVSPRRLYERVVRIGLGIVPDEIKLRMGTVSPGLEIGVFAGRLYQRRKLCQIHVFSDNIV